MLNYKYLSIKKALNFYSRKAFKKGFIDYLLLYQFRLHRITSKRLTLNCINTRY
jgi:hypothetical protein